MTDPLVVLYRDEHLVVADKPTGLVVHRGWANDRVTAVDIVRDLIGSRVYPLHRIDRGTSGALLFALDPSTAAKLARAFEHGHVEKRYVALVRGHLTHEGYLDHPIPGREHGPRIEAQTSYRGLGLSPTQRCSLAEAFPHTGRLHQIRRHLKHLTHPVVGDVRYGDGRINRHYRDHFGLHRLALHAHVLAFPHPHRPVHVRVHAPLPASLSDPFGQLGLSLAALANDAAHRWTGCAPSRRSGDPLDDGGSPSSSPSEMDDDHPDLLARSVRLRGT